MTPYRSSKLSVQFNYNSEEVIELSDESIAMMEEIQNLKFADSISDNLDELDYPIIRELLNIPQSEELNINLDEIIDQLISNNMTRRSAELLEEVPANSPTLDEFWEIVEPMEKINITDYHSSITTQLITDSDPLAFNISGELSEQIYSPHSLISEESSVLDFRKVFDFS